MGDGTHQEEGARWRAGTGVSGSRARLLDQPRRRALSFTAGSFGQQSVAQERCGPHGPGQV